MKVEDVDDTTRRGKTSWHIFTPGAACIRRGSASLSANGRGTGGFCVSRCPVGLRSAPSLASTANSLAAIEPVGDAVDVRVQQRRNGHE